MSDTGPLAVSVTGLYFAWFGVHYWRDTKTHIATDPIKAVLTGKPIPTTAKGKAPSASIKTGLTGGTTNGGATPSGNGTAEGVVATAKSQVGNSQTTYINDYGNPASTAGEWCAVFLWWCFNKNGVANLLLGKTASVPTLSAQFQHAGQYHSGTSGIQDGDVVFQNGNVHAALWVGGTDGTISGNWSNKVSVSGATLNGLGIAGYGRPKWPAG